MLEKAFMQVHTCLRACMCGHVFLCMCMCVSCLAVLLMFSMSPVVQEIKQGTGLCVSCLIRLR